MPFSFVVSAPLSFSISTSSRRISTCKSGSVRMIQRKLPHAVCCTTVGRQIASKSWSLALASSTRSGWFCMKRVSRMWNIWGGSLFSSVASIVCGRSSFSAWPSSWLSLASPFSLSSSLSDEDISSCNSFSLVSLSSSLSDEDPSSCNSASPDSESEFPSRFISSFLM